MELPEILQPRRNQIILGVVVFLLITILAVIFWPKPTAVAPDNTRVNLTWWKAFYGNEAYSDIIQDFKKLPGNQSVTINIVKKEWNDGYYKDLIGDIAGNAGPDIFTLRNDDLPAYQRYMTPINQFSGRLLADYKNDFVPLAVRDTIIKDKVYAVTSYVDNLQLYYNKNILSQQGIALPPTTWSEMDRQIRTTQLNQSDTSKTKFNQSAISLGLGFTDTNENTNINRFQDIIPTLIFQNGGQLYDYQSSRSVFGSDRNSRDVNTGLATTKDFDSKNVNENNPAYRALSFYKNFSDPDSQRYSWNTLSNNNIDAFVEGRLAYIIHYSYFKDRIAARSDRLPYGVSELPQLDTSLKKTYGFFFMDGLNRKLQTDVDASPRDPVKIKKLKKAEEFMYYLSQRSAQTSFVTKTKLPGARRDVVAQQIAADDNIRIFAGGSLYADNYYKPDVVKTEAIWGDMMYRIVFENQSLPDSLAEAIRDYNNLIQKGVSTR